MNRYYCIEFSFSCGNSNAYCDIFRAGTIYPIAINSLIYFSVFTKNCASDSMIINFVVKIFIQHIKGNFYQFSIARETSS